MAGEIALAGYTLVHANEYKEARHYRVASFVGVDTTVSRDIPAGKSMVFCDVDLTWEDMVLPELQQIETAWNAMILAGSATFVDPNGTTWTATVQPEAKAPAIGIYGGMRQDYPLHDTLYSMKLSFRLTPPV